MRIILFSKPLKDVSRQEMIDIAHKTGLEGYDLCVRPDYPVSPENVSEKLLETANMFNQENLPIMMVTGDFALTLPDHPTAEPILKAMDEADIRLLKLGFFPLDPEADYWQEVDRVRKVFEGWAELGKRYNVKICYQTHCGRNMGLNSAALMHLIGGLDPAYIGAYIDTGHLLVEGEEFCVGIAMVKEYLSIVAIKDVLMVREEANGHGRRACKWLAAGEGMVDWTTVFADLVHGGYEGPVTIHCEYGLMGYDLVDALKHDVDFYKPIRDAAVEANK
jgi:sugar phosphate isomerase/epimerase